MKVAPIDAEVVTRTIQHSLVTRSNNEHLGRCCPMSRENHRLTGVARCQFRARIQQNIHIVFGAVC